jgi:DHA1 family bicyclomycin/chloramphenicol resistance-like MFS transporter
MNKVKQPVNGLILLTLLGVLSTLDAMSIDIYFPGSPAIQQSMKTDGTMVQISLALSMIGLAMGQAFYGLMIDRYGRRLPLLAGTALFALGSVLIATAQNTAVFMIGRALQGIGGAVGFVIPLAIVADLYHARTAAKSFSLLMQVMTVGPLAAPALGIFLMEVLGWRSVFWMLATIGVLASHASFKLLPETLPVDKTTAASFLPTIKTHWGVMKRRQFTVYSLSGSLIMAGLFAYIASSSFIFLDFFKLSPATYGYIIAGNALGMAAIGQLNIFLLNFWTARQLLSLGLALHIWFTALLVAVILLDIAFLYIITLLFFLAMANTGLILGNVISVVMESARDQSGAASSLFGVLQYIWGGLSCLAVGALHNGTLLPPAGIMFICAIGSALFFRSAATKKTFRWKNRESLLLKNVCRPEGQAGKRQVKLSSS